MPAVDLSQLPEPAIIAEPDFEAILADTKAMMIASYPAEQREAVSAALELESEPLNVIAQTMSFREMLLRQRVNEGARACMLSHGSGTNLDNLAGNMNTKRLVITPATDTTDAVMESDTSLRLRAQRAYDGLSVAGPSGAYEYFARSASGLVRDARAISPSPACVTVSILSTEGDGTATEALLNTVRAVLNAEDTRPVADRLTVQSASIVTWRLNAKLYFYPGPESEPILAAAESSFRKWLAEQGLIGQDVALGEGSALPVGVPVPWPSATPPTGWLKCNGAAFSSEMYPRLARAYPTNKLPDLRGEFIRGWDDGRGIDAGRTLLSGQDGTSFSHYGGNFDIGSGHSINNYDQIVSNHPGFSRFSFAGPSRGDGVNYVTIRPRNIAFNYIIRAA